MRINQGKTSLKWSWAARRGSSYARATGCHHTSQQEEMYLSSLAKVALLYHPQQEEERFSLGLETAQPMKIHCTLNCQFPPMDFLFIPAPRNFPFSSGRVSFPFSLKYICTYVFIYLFIYLFICILSCHMACGTLVSWSRIKPIPPAMEAQSVNHWISREVPLCLFVCLFSNYLLGRARSVSTALRSKGTRSFE